MVITCRSCLKIHNISFNIFEHFRSNKLLSDILIECTAVEVQKDDGLPVNICHNCLEKLNIAYDFKVMVIESNKKLRSPFYKRTHESELQNNIVCDDLIIKEEIVKHESSTLINVSDNKLEAVISTTNRNDCSVLLTNILDSNFEQNTLMLNSQEKEWKVSEKGAINSNIDQIKDRKIAQKDVYIENLNQEEKEKMRFCKDTLTESDENSNCSNNMEVELTTNTKQVDVPPDKKSNSSAKLDMFNDYYKAKFGLTLQERNKKTIFCKECNRSFGFRYYFEIHVRHHTGNMPFKCDVCGKGFAKKFILKNHKVIHVNNKPFSCEECGKAYNALSSLITHKKVHSEEEPHKCDICNKTFKQSNLLKVHLQRHNGERKCTCEICGKSFINRGALSVHMACHANEKIFSCSQCGKSFANKARLSGHYKRHLNEKPHACNYCNKHFSTTAILRNHLLIHTGAKPYACKICDKTFRHKATLFNHKRIHTGETPFSCVLCPLKFKYKHHLANHMKTHK